MFRAAAGPVADDAAGRVYCRCVLYRTVLAGKMESLLPSVRVVGNPINNSDRHRSQDTRHTMASGLKAERAVVSLVCAVCCVCVRVQVTRCACRN